MHTLMVPVRRGLWTALLALLALGGAVGCGDDNNPQVQVEPEPENNDTNNDSNNEPNNDVPDAGNNEPDIPIIIDEDADDDDGPTCSFEDELAPNHSAEQAADIGTDVDRDDLFICSGSPDWYRFDLEAGQSLLLFVEFDAQLGDLDIYLYAEGATERGTELASSTSPNQSEFIQFEATATGTYLLEIEGFEGNQNAYRLFAKLGCDTDADCPDGSACFLRGGFCNGARDLDCGIDDGFEPNESATDATEIGDGTQLGLSICPEDEDYYAVDVPEEGGLILGLEHPRDVNIDLLLFNEAGDFFGQGQDRTGGEDLPARFLPPGRYIILVDQPGQGAGGPTEYDLTVTIEEGSCTADIDCTGVFGREFCNIDLGTCEGIDSNGGQGLGEACDDDNDCTRESDGCYEGTEGAGDNICTVLCDTDDECGEEFGPGAYCFELDPIGNVGICVRGCQDDFECSAQFFCDTEAGRCLSRECGVDEDCPRENESCVYNDSDDSGLCVDYDRFQSPDCGVGTGVDEGDNGSTSRAELIELNPDGTFIEGLQICDVDEDWYALELTEPSNNLTVDVEFDGSADLDVYIVNAEGRTVGAGTSPDGNPEQALGTFLAAGVYYVRVNKFPSDNGDPEVSYALNINVGDSDCNAQEGACNNTTPLRFECNEETGSCDDLQGDGQVPVGELCDTSDDCAETADFCLTFQGAGEGQNVCSLFCTSNEECEAIPGTQCFAIRRNLGVCAFP